MTVLIHATEHEHHNGGIGYSFAKFSGPVSGKKISDINLPLNGLQTNQFQPPGPAKEIHTNDEHHGPQVDYVAKPDYQFVSQLIFLLRV